MKRWILLLLFPFPLFAAPEAAVELKIPKGMITNYDSLNLSEEYASDAQNVFFDEDLGASKRGGYSRVNSVSVGTCPVRGLYGFKASTLTVTFSTNSTEYLVMFAGSSMAYSLGSDTFTIVIGTLNAGYPVDCAQAFGRLWCVNKDIAFAWVGGTRTIDLDESFPRGTMIEAHADRLWVAGVAKNESTVYGSKFLDGFTWTLGGSAVDPVQIPVGARDGDTLSCMKSYADALILGKTRSLWGIVGKSQEDFTMKNLSNQIGCVSDESVQEKQGKLYWLSDRGLEKFQEGLVDPPFGDPVKDITDKFLAGAVGEQNSSYIDTTQQDFELGVSSYVDLPQIPGTVIPMIPSTKTIDLYDGDSGCNFYAMSPVHLSTVAQSFKLDFIAPSNIISAKVVVAYDAVGWPSPAPYSDGNTLKFSIQASDVNFSTKPSGTPIGRPRDLISQDIYPGVQCGSVKGYLQELLIDTVSLVNNATYWIVFQDTYAIAGQLYYIAQSTRGNAYGDGFAYTQTPAGVESLSDSDVYFRITFSSALIQSREFDFGSTEFTGAQFSPTYTNGNGSTHFYSKSAATSGGLTGASWVSQDPNTSLSSLNNFYKYRADFGFRDISSLPSLQQVNLNIRTKKNKPKLASGVIDGRYYLSGSTWIIADTTNETILVVDKFDNFTRLNGMNASSFAKAFGENYFGTSKSSGAEGGLYYKMVDSFSDDGRAIDAYVTTKDYCFESCSQIKNFTKIYPKTKNDGSSGGVFSTECEFDRDGNMQSLGEISLTESLGLIFGKIPFPYGSNGMKGKSIQLKFRNNQASHDFRYYGGTLFYRPSPVY